MTSSRTRSKVFSRASESQMAPRYGPLKLGTNVSEQGTQPAYPVVVLSAKHILGVSQPDQRTSQTSWGAQVRRGASYRRELPHIVLRQLCPRSRPSSAEQTNDLTASPRGRGSSGTLSRYFADMKNLHELAQFSHSRARDSSLRSTARSGVRHSVPAVQVDAPADSYPWSARGPLSECW